MFLDANPLRQAPPDTPSNALGIETHTITGDPGLNANGASPYRTRPVRHSPAVTRYAIVPLRPAGKNTPARTLALLTVIVPPPVTIAMI